VKFERLLKLQLRNRMKRSRESAARARMPCYLVEITGQQIRLFWIPEQREQKNQQYARNENVPIQLLC
jgi:hypothetical protein